MLNLDLDFDLDLDLDLDQDGQLLEKLSSSRLALVWSLLPHEMIGGRGEVRS